MPTVTVTIRNGKMQIDAEGFVGDGCMKATEKLRAILDGGGDVNIKPEFYQQKCELQNSEVTE